MSTRLRKRSCLHRSALKQVREWRFPDVIDTEEGIMIDATQAGFDTWVDLDDTGFQLMIKANDFMGIFHVRKKPTDE